jgi:hypothetical protein
MTGSVFLPWGEVERVKLQVTEGRHALLVIGDTCASHEVRCQACLSLLYWSPSAGDNVRVPYGALVDAPSLRPTAHVFVGSKASWHEIIDDLPRYDEGPET